jgi:hypothetical protein
VEEATSGLAMLHPGREEERERERNASHHQGVTLTNALTAAQELHAEAKNLPPDVRAVYLQEIKDVGALFAYTDPETSILKGFLEQRRRIALAEQVNAAILGKSSRPLTLSEQQQQGRMTAVVLSPRTPNSSRVKLL